MTHHSVELAKGTAAVDGSFLNEIIRGCPQTSSIFSDYQAEDFPGALGTEILGKHQGL